MKLNSFFTHFFINTFYNICISDFFLYFSMISKILCYSYLEKHVKFLITKYYLVQEKKISVQHYQQIQANFKFTTINNCHFYYRRVGNTDIVNKLNARFLRQMERKIYLRSIMQHSILVYNIINYSLYNTKIP